MKKLITLLLLIALMTSSFISCSGDTDKTDETTTGDTAADTTVAVTELTDGVPELDFDGLTFRFVTMPASSTYFQMVYDEQSGDVLRDSMYERTKYVEERFNMTFAEDHVINTQVEMLSSLRASVAAGDDDGDVYMPSSTGAFTIVNENMFYDFRDLPHVDLEADWWYTELNDLNNLTDSIYLAYGAMNLGVYDFLNVTLFNKNMIDSYNLDDPYGLVWDGTWTFDKMAEMARTVVSDADGDGTVSVGDIFGYAGRANSLPGNFLSAAKLRTVDADSDGIPYLVTDNERIIEVFTKTVDLFYEDGFWYTSTKLDNNYYAEFPFFENDQALFADRSFYSVSDLRNMESDFGVIPFPKYDEEQDGYGVMFEAGSRLCIVPVTVTNHELIGAVLEAMNFYSLQNVIPAYYEISLKQKYARDEESIKMLDLVSDSIFHDLGNTTFCSQVKDGIYKTLFQGRSTALASMYESMQPQFKAQLEKAMID